MRSFRRYCATRQKACISCLDLTLHAVSKFSRSVDVFVLKLYHVWGLQVGVDVDYGLSSRDLWNAVNCGAVRYHNESSATSFRCGAAAQEIPCILGGQKIHYRVEQEPATCTYPERDKFSPRPHPI